MRLPPQLPGPCSNLLPSPNLPREELRSKPNQLQPELRSKPNLRPREPPLLEQAEPQAQSLLHRHQLRPRSSPEADLAVHHRLRPVLLSKP